MGNKAKELFQEFQKEQELKDDKKNHDSNNNLIKIIGVALICVSSYKFSNQWHLSIWIILGFLIGGIMIKIGNE